MRKLANRKLITIFLPLALIVGSFLIAPAAKADWVIDIVAGFLGIFISALGIILAVCIQALIYIAQYQDFLNSQAVILGWVIVRDVCNMFFVVILMIIAFGTILNIPDYSYKKWLPKLILFAILINFSKTICGLLIDVTQVVMLTFVNAFKDIGGANLTEVLGITDIVTMAEFGGAEVGFWTVVGAYVLGLAYLLVAIVVIVTMVMMLTMRLVMIWIYVVLSPAAYLLSAVPGGQSYASKWWDEFTKNLIVGPVLAFFIWLSLASLNADQTIKNMGLGADVSGDLSAVGSGLNQSGGAIPSVAGQPSGLIKFVVGIGMLVGGLMVSQQIGGAAGGLAGKGMGALQKGASIGTKFGLGGVAAVTGYRYASGVTKQYLAMRKSKREDKYKDGAVNLARGIGVTKQGLANIVNVPLRKLKDKTFGRSGVKARELSEEARQHREEADKARHNYNKKSEVMGWKYDDSANLWKDSSGATKTHDEMANVVDDHATAEKLKAKNKDVEASKERDKQDTVDKMFKYGAYAVAAPLALALGGLPGLAAVVAAPKLGKSIKEAGDVDLGLASDFRMKKVSEEKNNMKYESDSDVVAIMDDSSKSAFTRTAAALEAMDRKLLSLDQVIEKKTEIKKMMGGHNEDEDKSWKDKRLGSYVEGVVDKNYIGASRIFEDLNSKKSDKKEKAEREISNRFERGTYSLDLDSDTLEKSISILVNSMKTGDFVNQFNGLKDSQKKEAIVKSLVKEDSFAAKEKLAQIKDLDFAFGADIVGKEKVVASFSFNDLKKIFEDARSVNQQNAIKNLVAKTSTFPKIDLFKSAKSSLEDASPAAVAMRRKLGI